MKVVVQKMSSYYLPKNFDHIWSRILKNHLFRNTVHCHFFILEQFSILGGDLLFAIFSRKINPISREFSDVLITEVSRISDEKVSKRLCILTFWVRMKMKMKILQLGKNHFYFTHSILLIP